MKRIFNRFVSCILVGCMTTSSMAFATDVKEDVQVIPSGNSAYHCEITWDNDTDFTVTGYLNDEVTETVTGSIGGETVTLTTYSDSERSLSKTEYKVSDIITKVEDNESVLNDKAEVVASPRAVSNKYAGSVTYRQPTSSGKYKNVYVYAFYTDINNSTVDNYALNADSGTLISVLISAVVSATGVYLTSYIMAFIVGALGGAVSNSKLTQSVHGYFTGTKYDYNVRFQNKYSNPTATELRSGSAFNGYFRKTTTDGWVNSKAYEGFYPQFIREKDRAVANSAYNFFYDGSMTITNWNNQY